MKKSKAVSLLLSLSLLVSTAIPGTLALPVYAAGDGDEKKGMEISKTAADNGDGTYTITLEAYATGEKFSTEVTKDVPADIVLVLDQSRSMTSNMNTYDFRLYENKDNSDYYDLRHNGGRNENLYHKLDDGSYVTVSVERHRPYTYTECPTTWTNDGGKRSDYYSNRENLYIKNGENYEKVELVRTGSSIWGYTFTYTFPDGSTIVSKRSVTVPDFQGKGPLYVRSESQDRNTYEYTYSYTDSNGDRQEIGTSTGQNTEPDFSLYERFTVSSMSRLQALKNAVSGFTNSVSEKAKGEDGILGTGDDVDHRVAVVGFATGNYTNDSSDYPTYENTEVFVGSTQYNYNNNASSYYKEALQDMNTQAGQDNVNASTDALAARGATYPNYGLEMAKGILDANPVPQDEKRSRVVVLFTDGSPGWSGYESDVANAAISEAQELKNDGVTVYSVGIFEGADATSAGIAEGANNRQANQFMQNVSSNNGTPQDPSYYLSASDADTLNDIFEQISDNIEQGGSSTTLDEQAVIKDIIAPQFELPAGTTVNDIKLETYRYTGENQWVENNDKMGAVATINGDKVDVTGFNFSENWCGTETTNGQTTYRGNKLVISFPVTVKDGFLGGNGVYTNTSAGVYENGDATEPMFEFERPDVDVEIKDITVTAKDKNVYLLGDLTADQIKSGATAKVGDVELKLGKENYGLESWQYEYVNIEVSYQDKDGNTVTDLSDLKEDTTYSVSVKVTPKNSGTVSEQSGKGDGTINVFKPELTYKDSEVYYGDTVPADFTANKVSESWKHGDTTSSDEGVVMTGDAPVLAMTYTPDDTKIQDGKVNTKQDVPVKAEVKIGTEDVQQYTTFVHQDCSPACGWNETTLDGDPAFLLHVKTCQLTINKQGGAGDEPYVFDVYKDDKKYTEVTIVGNNSEIIYELPVGTYTIQEDEGWSWRYSGNNGSGATLTAEKPDGWITCTNSKDNNYWLNGFSEVVKNIFGGKN